MVKTTRRFAPDVCKRTGPSILEHEVRHAARWSAILSITVKISYTGQMPNAYFTAFRPQAVNAPLHLRVEPSRFKPSPAS